MSANQILDSAVAKATKLQDSKDPEVAALAKQVLELKDFMNREYCVFYHP